jgi:Uncharacterised nucleotidyltransferase
LTLLDREHDLILALARGAVTPVLSSESLYRVDYERLRVELERLKLLGLLGSRLVDRAPPGSVSPAFADAVSDVLREGAFNSMRNQLLTTQLWREMERAGIPALPLKGPFLALRLHGDVAFRLSHDIDLLVAPDHIRPAIKLMEASGFVWRVGRGRPVLHYVLEGKHRIPVELHWRVSWYEAEYSQATLARSFVEGDIRRPAPIDELAILLLVHARDGLSGLRTPVDIAAWWANDSQAVSADELRGLIVKHPALRRPLTAAAIAVEETLCVPVATGLLGTIPVERRTRSALALADWRSGVSEASQDALVKVVDGLLTDWRAVPTWVRRAMFPRLPGDRRSEAARRGLYAAALSRRAVPILTWGFIRSSPRWRPGCRSLSRR